MPASIESQEWINITMNAELKKHSALKKMAEKKYKVYNCFNERGNDSRERTNAIKHDNKGTMMMENNFTDSTKDGAACLSSELKMAMNCAEDFEMDDFGDAIAIELSAKCIDLTEHLNIIDESQSTDIAAAGIASNCNVRLQHRKIHAVKGDSAIHLKRHNAELNAGRIKKDVYECAKSRLPATIFGEFTPDFYDNLGACPDD